MYLGRRPPVLAEEQGPSHGREQRLPGRRVGRNVVFLGLTSLFTDVSSEMVNSVLPLYLTYALRWSPLQFGLFDGIYQAMSALLRGVGATIADRRGRYKEVAAAGYTVSAVCKLGLLAAGNAWVASTAVLFTDRVGKGIRTAPRDALISFSSRREDLAWVFGVHRALDTVGVMVGPFIAFVLLSMAPGAFDAVFVTSFCFAVIGLAMLILFVENRRPLEWASPAVPVSFGSVFPLLGRGPFRSLVLAGSVLGLATVGDNLVFLTLQRRVDLRIGFFPLLFVATASVYLVLAVPLGRLADRVGRVKVLLGGYASLAGVYAVLLSPGTGLATVGICLALLGAYYAATDGVLMAIASSVVPLELRSSGLALLTTVVACSRALASVLFGAVWTWKGQSVALWWFLAGLVAALTAAFGLVRSHPALRR
ncbi:MAG: MFS transporter [Acidimicrobiales bacterium]